MKGAAARSKRQMSPVVDLIEFGVVLVFRLLLGSHGVIELLLGRSVGCVESRLLVDAFLGLVPTVGRGIRGCAR